MARDKVLEIETIRKRKLPHEFSTSLPIGELVTSWLNLENRSYFDSDFTIIRMVTILEVAFQNWVIELIEFGEPYTGNSLKMAQSKNIRLDFNVFRAIHGKRVSIGELLSHSLPCNDIGNIESVLTDIIGENIFNSIRSVVDRVEVEINNKTPQPIIKDIETCKKALVRIFNIRHIIVHELPKEPPYGITEIEAMLENVKSFLNAVSQYIATLLHGNYPLTQMAMNIEASTKAQALEQELLQILQTIDPNKKDKDLWKTQKVWENYRKLQCEYRSGINKPFAGSIAPTLYGLESASLTKQRIALMKWYAERKEGEL